MAPRLTSRRSLLLCLVVLAQGLLQPLHLLSHSGGSYDEHGCACGHHCASTAEAGHEHLHRRGDADRHDHHGCLICQTWCASHTYLVYSFAVVAGPRVVTAAVRPHVNVAPSSRTRLPVLARAPPLIG